MCKTRPACLDLMRAERESERVACYYLLGVLFVFCLKMFLLGIFCGGGDFGGGVDDLFLLGVLFGCGFFSSVSVINSVTYFGIKEHH